MPGRPRKDRLLLDLRRKKVPSVPLLGRYNYTEARASLPEHSHAHAVEICYLARGRQTYCIGSQRYDLQGGDLFFTLPGEVHGTGSSPEEKGVLYWLILLDPRETGHSLLGLSAVDSMVLWNSIIQFPRRHFPGAPEMKELLESIIAITRKKQTPLDRVALQNHLIRFCLMVGEACLTVKSPNGQWTRFEKVFAHIQSHIDDPDALVVPVLAKVAGLSPSRFKASFKQKTGVPPAEYALRARIAEARLRLMDPTVPITKVAIDLGFSSSQYFASTFKRFAGVTASAARYSAKLKT